MITSHINPVDSSFNRVLEMGRNLTESAIAIGLSPVKAIRVPLLGINRPQGWYVQENRTAIISYSQPPTSQYDAELWVNPINKKIFKSTPSNRQWVLVLTYQELFAETTTQTTVLSPTDLVGQPVSDIPELLALDTNPIPDKSMYYVESVRSIYAFDREGADAINPPSTLKPNVGPGRWYLITSTTAALGNIDGGIF